MEINKNLKEFFFTVPFPTCTGTLVMLLLCLTSHYWLLQHLTYLGTHGGVSSAPVHKAAGAIRGLESRPSFPFQLHTPHVRPIFLLAEGGMNSGNSTKDQLN